MSDDATTVAMKHSAKIVGFVLKFDDLNEVEIWADPDKTSGGMNVGTQLVDPTMLDEHQNGGGIFVPGRQVVLRIFQLACQGVVRRAERRTTPELPLLELREVAAAARAFRDVYVSRPDDDHALGEPVGELGAFEKLSAALDRLGTL